LPSISTHVNLAQMVVHRLAPACDRFCFVLGTLAPDSFDRSDEASFRTHHFAGAGGDSDLAGFLDLACPPERRQDARQSSFAVGYYAHLWLDNYVRANEDALPLAHADARPAGELPALIRATMEWYNLHAIAGFVRGIEPAACIPAAGLEFVSEEKVNRSWRQLLTASQEVGRLPQPVLVIAEAAYTGFLLDAAARFLAALPAALTRPAATMRRCADRRSAGLG